jgi:hypothetical protein
MSGLVLERTRHRARHGAQSDAAAGKPSGGLPAQGEGCRAGHKEARRPRPYARSNLPKSEDVMEDVLEAIYPACN